MFRYTTKETRWAPFPKNYKLEPTVNEKLVRSRKYHNWTVADIRDLIADLPDDATVWISRYDEAADDILLRPLENAGSSSDGKRGYITLG